MTTKEASAKLIFGACLRMARIGQNISQIKLAGDLNIGLRSLQRYEAGERFPPLDVNKKLHELLPLLEELESRFEYEILDKESYQRGLRRLLKTYGTKR